MSNGQPKVVLIAGGCGFIGSNFINYMFNQWSSTLFINVDKLILNSDISYVSITRYHVIHYHPRLTNQSPNPLSDTNLSLLIFEITTA
jgi:UDP-glucose 4-epimerase